MQASGRLRRRGAGAGLPARYQGRHHILHRGGQALPTLGDYLQAFCLPFLTGSEGGGGGVGDKNLSGYFFPLFFFEMVTDNITTG